MKKEKDLRYEATGIMYGRGDILTFFDLFKYMPRSIVQRDLGTEGKKWKMFMKDAGSLTYNIMEKMAALYELDVTVIADLIHEYKKAEVETAAHMSGHSIAGSSSSS